jgi:hypothetical protein
LWDRRAALPLIGTLDTARERSVVDESLLAQIVETNSRLRFIELPAFQPSDTLGRQHLIKTVKHPGLIARTASSAIRTQIVKPSSNLGGTSRVTTKSRADAFVIAFTSEKRAS